MQSRDWDLVKRAQAGDMAAFTELVVHYKDRLFNFIYRMIHSREEAEDLLQEVFLRVYKSLSSYSPQFQFSTWIYRIAQNLCIDTLRKQRVPTVSVDCPLGDDEDLVMELPDQSMSPEVLFESADLRREVESAIADLPPKYRAVIVLRHLQGLSYEEISLITDLPVNTVKTHIFRARRILRERLKDVV